MGEGKKHGGKRNGSGRKAKAKAMGLAEILDRAWPQEMRLAWFERLAEWAAEGDKEAGRILTDRTYGKSTEHQHISGGISITVKDDTIDSA